MGRNAKYRNAAEKQKAYRQRKKQAKQGDFWQSEDMQALRKKLLWIKSRGWLRLEVTRSMAHPGTVFYHVLASGLCYANLDAETFQKLAPVLTLERSSKWDDTYTINVP